MIAAVSQRPLSRQFGRESQATESGQAAVELVAILPLVGLAAILSFHLALAGWGLWSAAESARAGARAAEVDSNARRIALAALPTIFRERASIDLSAGKARVSLVVPSLLPGVNLPRVQAEAGPFGSQG